MEEQNREAAPESAHGELAKIVMIRPGTAQERALIVDLSQVPPNCVSIEQILNYALNDMELTRGQQRIAERIRTEMQGEYGMMANSQSVESRTKVSSLYVRDQSDGGVPFERVDVVIAANQEGGLYL